MCVCVRVRVCVCARARVCVCVLCMARDGRREGAGRSAVCACCLCARLALLISALHLKRWGVLALLHSMDILHNELSRDVAIARNKLPKYLGQLEAEKKEAKVGNAGAKHKK